MKPTSLAEALQRIQEEENLQHRNMGQQHPKPTQPLGQGRAIFSKHPAQPNYFGHGRNPY